MTAARALLGGLIDYAGLFPPASLDLTEAVAEYRDARSGPNGWIIHRFLCPASRLEDLAGLVAGSMTAGEPFWSVGIVADLGLGPSVAAGQAFEAEMAPAASIAAFEVRLASLRSGPGTDREAAVVAAADSVATLGESVYTYFEVDLGDDPVADVEAVARVARTGRPVAGKVRCGGVSADAVPSPRRLGEVLVAAAGQGLPIKATAGLHHPVRRHDAALGADTHGFLNLAVAQHLAASGSRLDEVVAALEETDASVYEFGVARLVWRGHEIGLRSLQQQRALGLHGFGSCSFAEPVEDLVALGVPGVVA